MLKCVKFTLLLFAVLLTVNGYSQCTKVCIQGGTITPSGTQTVTPAAGSTFTTQQKAGTSLTVTPVGSYSVATTYSNVTVAGTGTITVGALSVSIANVGSAGALFNGVTLPAGAIINLNIPNAILPQYTYNCLTSNLLIVVNR